MAASAGIAVLLPALVLTSSRARSGDGVDMKRVRELQSLIDKLKPLHKKMGPHQPGDWLLYDKEPGQTFLQYLSSNPVVATKERRVIHILPIGEFDAGEKKILKKTAKFLAAFFCLPVVVDKGVPLSAIPAEARRNNYMGEQLLSTYILDRILIPRRAKDAVFTLGMTASDLWPGKGWNFVFGQASLRERVGVWSIRRNGNPNGTEEEFALCLLRTLKTASHESGHMLSMFHCVAYECGMCGSNNRAESDRRPLAFCPECLAKLLWATGADPRERFEKLIKFCEENGLENEADFYKKELAAIKKGNDHGGK